MTRTSPTWIQECVVIYLRIPAGINAKSDHFADETVVDLFPGELS